MNIEKLYCLLFIVATTIFCHNLIAKNKVTSYSIALSDPSKKASLKVSLMYGSIAIEGYNGKTIELSTTVNKMSQLGSNKGVYHDVIDRQYTQYGKNKRTKLNTLDLSKNSPIKLHIDENNNEVLIKSTTRNQHIALSIKVPLTTNLEMILRRSNDDIKITNVYGAINVENIRGSIIATGIHGPIIAETHRQNLNIVFDKFNEEKPSSLNSEQGNIDVTLPKKSKTIVNVKNYQGEIYSGINAEFTDTSKTKNINMNTQQALLGSIMSAQLNNGTQILTLNTLKGDIYIREK